MPRLKSAKLSGYTPLFSKTVAFEIKHGSFIVLGGNGLGKTTVLQSIVYCMAGEADDDIEQEKNRRWGRQFFQGRIDDPDAASVEVDFYLGDDIVTLTRGFQTKNLKRVALNNEVISENSNEAEREFENYLKENAGYSSLVDFRFLLHKLCYLSEDRENIVWDIDTQIRLLMLLFQDIIAEAEFRDKRATLKKLDSKLRHTNVAINRAEKQLETLYEYDESSIEEEEEYTEEQGFEVLEIKTEEQRRGIFGQLSEKSEQRKILQRHITDDQKQLSQLTSEIEVLQEKLAEEEERFILNQLTQIESQETKLAIHKLIYRKRCPACGSLAGDLSEKASGYSSQGRCPLCGSEQSIEPSGEIGQLDGQLSEKIGTKIEKEQALISLIRKSESISAEEQALQYQYDSFRLREPIISPTYEARPEEKEKLEDELNNLRVSYADDKLRFNDLQAELQEKYISFKRQAAQRMELLGDSYESYATHFLGIKCELIPLPADAKFLELDLYIPKFADKVRPNPHSCSESQRFFLDIAFRMAMIDLAKQLSNSSGSFICETPESALDIAYIENVAGMFNIFAEHGHSILSTSNIQPGSLAKPILSKYTKQQRPESILNLMKYGLLTDVQRVNLPELEKQLAYILE